MGTEIMHLHNLAATLVMLPLQPQIRNGVLTCCTAAPERGDPDAHWKRWQEAQSQLELDGGLIDARRCAVDAIISYMRCISDGNALTIAPNWKTVTSDTPDNRKLWEAHAPVALELLQPLLRGGTTQKDAAVASWHAEALTYKESARGIVKSATSGGAVAFLSATSTLYSSHRQHDSAVACIYRGAFYLAAPWPLGSVTKARALFDEAHREFPESRRNRYYAGVGAWADRDDQAARLLFESSLEAPPAPPGRSENDIRSFLQRAAAEAIVVVGGA